MVLELFAHPFSSYCQKVLIALYENDTPFEYRLLAPEQPQNLRRLAELWPLRRFPLLADCAAAPFLFYADWTQPIGEAFPTPARLSPAPAAAALLRPCRGRSAALPGVVPAGGAGSGLTGSLP